MLNSKLQLIIDNLKSLINEMKNSDLHLKIPPGFISSLGEFIVFSKILQTDTKSELKSGHTGADIKLSNGRKIEVKTARINKDYKDYMHWGFGRIKPEKFDYLVCVALDENLNPDFYMFKRDEAMNFPTEKEAHEGRTTRFNSSEGRTFHRFKIEYEKSQRSKILIEVNRNIKNYEDRWDILFTQT
ncbi:Uncharacterised protein [uncultured archaeon]|nr:Uncharacterised protein [uncultured archaeon]